MSEVAINVEGISKKYLLGTGAAGTLRELVTGLVKSKPHTEEFWALRDVSFKVNTGDIVGIIGRNGAGKSTLLKILSRITKPTSGNAEINGRVASLLEVGTGFNPELTGSENIFLNGTILGMSRAEVKSKYDEIVEFSGVEKFLNTPVKHYSSGMYVRLAFAVAAHLEPEILIIDEVLAVGDAEFQKRCLGKMSEVSKSGRTILFVSHNMASIIELCNKGILLNQGTVQDAGPMSKVVITYLSSLRGKLENDRKLEDVATRTGNQAVQFTAFDIKDTNGNSLGNVVSGQDIEIHLKFKINKPGRYDKVHFSVSITDEYDRLLFHVSTTESLGKEFSFNTLTKEGVVICKIDNLLLNAGIYNTNFFVSDLSSLFDSVDLAESLQVEDGNFFGSGRIKQSNLGAILVKSNWQLNEY